jgi:hypothetical protein
MSAMLPAVAGHAMKEGSLRVTGADVRNCLKANQKLLLDNV